MTIGRDYMLKTPDGPSKPKLFLDTQVVPRIANIAGGVEVALDHASVRMGVRPSVILAGVTCLLSFGMFGLLRNRRAGVRTSKEDLVA